MTGNCENLTVSTNIAYSKFLEYFSNFHFCRLHEKCPKSEFSSGQCFPIFGLNTEKYGPVKPPNSDSLAPVGFAGEANK